MKLFLDTANVDEIKKFEFMIDGVTTNPTLIMMEGRDYNEALKEICGIVKGPVSAEAVSLDAEGMVKEGKEFSKIAKNIIIKIPMTNEGMKAVQKLTKLGIKTNVTLVFSANQALLAAKAGATYVSPFVGRLDDIGQDGMLLIEEILDIYDNYEIKTEVIVASIRNPDHVKRSAIVGAGVATIPSKILEKMFNHSLTDKGIKQFLADWEKVPKK
ncbi:fructose-6-phosphate aldolase [Candidatus Woesearchaeota archaeon]|nr:fructose-6-phosphate aldolase [Candidatus Woesearchaeota archaeon]